MRRRTIPPLLLAVALCAPSTAGASVLHFGPASSDPAAVSPKQALHRAERVVGGHGVRDGRELTPLLKQVAVALPRLDGTARARATRLLARPTRGDAAANEDAYSVPEHAGGPFCTAHFCIHWVDSSVDAPPRADTDGDGVPDYVETMDAVFEHVYDVENGQMGWRAPKSDGVRGCPGGAPTCANRTDVYIKELGGQGIYGYSAPDPGQKSLSQAAYLVMDNDYSAQQFPKYGGDPLQPMEVTAAHEYNHVLQFAYDVAQDTWMFESTAVWMEEKVYTEVNDYLQYLVPWAQMTFVPLTQFNSRAQDDPANVKVYGDMVWNRWIEANFGDDAIRNAWERSLTTPIKSFAPGAYDQALKARGSSFFEAFTRFAADTAEWRVPGSPFAEGSTFPTVARVRDSRSGNTIRLSADRGGAGGALPHTTYGLLDVTPTNQPRLKLVVRAPHGAQVALALVGRTGDDTTGAATVALTRLSHGGTGVATLSDPGQYSRLTAVIVNGDGRTTGRYSASLQDWQWVSDDVNVSARVSTDFTPPAIDSRSPGPGQHGVSRSPLLRVGFSEALDNLGRRTVRLYGPGGRKVKARVSGRAGGRRMVLRPTRPLAAGRRYELRLTRDVVDGGGNRLPASTRRWTFYTAR